MDNYLSGFQLVAAHGLVQGEGLGPPNIAANLNAYNKILTVNNFSNIYSTATTLPFGLTNANANLLMAIGSNSFPHLFGQVPNDFSSELNVGPLFTIAPTRTEAWFANSDTANVYLQVLSQAQSYAMSAHAVLTSASQTQWNGGPSSSLTNGFSAIIGDSNPSNYQIVGNAISQLGTLMLPSDPLNGFSNADCFNRILQSGMNMIGNLHLNFFGKTIIDPTNGNSLIINSKLFQYIMNNPVGLSADDPFKIAALNPLDILLGEMANTALAQTGDLDAVVTYFGIEPLAATSIYQWTDVFNLPLMLGQKATQIITEKLQLVTLDAYHFINAMINNVSGFTNISSLYQLGQIIAQINPLTNSSNLASLTSPISTEQFANLQASFGPGSGSSGNPTVDDILGSTNYNQALQNTIVGLQPIIPSPYYANISTDTSNIRNALTNNVFPVTLSDGSVYNDINSLAVGGTTLINKNASVLANNATSITNVALFKDYNNIAQTHNNSANLTAANSFIPINPTAIASDSIAAYPQASGFAGLILSIIFRFFGASQSVKIDNPPQATMFMRVPGAPSFSSSSLLSSFSSSLASMASLTTQLPTANEITGLNNVVNCIDMNTITGQALQATISEAKNNQLFTNNNIPNKSFSANPAKITTYSNISVLGGV